MSPACFTGLRVVFLEGSDNNPTELEAFQRQRRDDPELGRRAGGSLFVNAAPNEDDGMASV